MIQENWGNGIEDWGILGFEARVVVQEHFAVTFEFLVSALNRLVGKYSGKTPTASGRVVKL